MDERELHAPVYTPELLVNALKVRSAAPLFRLEDGGVLTVGQVRDATSRYVQALSASGVGRATRLALVSPNRPECLHVTNAVQLLAAVYVPMHPLAGFDDHLHALEDAGAEALVFDPERFGTRALELAERLPGLRLLGLGRSEAAPDLRALAEAMEPQALVAPRVAGDDLMRIGYSGGTTGTPKALLSCQRTALAAGRIMQAEWEWPDPPHILTCAPLSHAGGAMFMPALLRGGTVLVLPRFEPVAVMEAIGRHRINCMLLVPTMLYAMLDHPRFDEFDLSSLETVFYGASAISPHRLKEAIERIGPVFAQFYGQAEAPMAVCYMRKADHVVHDPVRLACCGRPSPSLRVQLQDPEGVEVPDGEPGEICVRGPLVMNGYRDPRLTAEALRGGWLHTGDVAVRDGDGFLRIVDRVKDMIVSGGFNVYPREIEDVIGCHPAVAQVAVIGRPHPKWGEAVTAVIVTKAGMVVDPDEIVALVAERKGAFQAPKRVEFVHELPLTPVGKPDKKALRSRRQPIAGE